METYLSGKKLYGDDFNSESIMEWYKDEIEGYYKLDIIQKEKVYNYHHLNIIHGFNKLPKNKIFKKVLGIGSAFGFEFLPIANRIEELYIIEPSDNMISDEIGKLKPIYIKPETTGRINFNDEEFDLVICLSALHHIPNVSFVMGKVFRCLKKDGFFISKEPIRSMGDWRGPRKGLTKRERGIPVKIYREINMKLGYKVVSEKFCFTLTPSFERIFKKLLKKPVYSYKSYIRMDSILSYLLKWNTIYHPKGLKKIGPGALYYVLQKH